MRLHPAEIRWLVGLWAAMFPPHPAFPAGVHGAALAPFVPALWAVAPAETRLGLRLATWALWWGAVLYGGRPFGALSPERQQAFLAALDTSRFYVLRELPQLLKLTGALGWAGLPGAQAALGVPAPDAAPPAWVPR
jgi:hypothetical protein